MVKSDQQLENAKNMEQVKIWRQRLYMHIKNIKILKHKFQNLFKQRDRKNKEKLLLLKVWDFSEKYFFEFTKKICLFYIFWTFFLFEKKNFLIHIPIPLLQIFLPLHLFLQPG